MHRMIGKRTVGMLAGLALSALGGAAFAADPAAVQQARDTGACAGCDLSGADLMALHADAGDLSFSNMTGAELYRSSLSGANLAGAVLVDANMRHAQLAGADMSGAVLSGADLSGANLSGANMSAVLTDTYTNTDASTTCPDGSAGPCNF